MAGGMLTISVQLDPNDAELVVTLEAPAESATVGWVKQELCRQDPTGSTSPDSFHLQLPSRPGVPLAERERLTAERSALVLHSGSEEEVPQAPAAPAAEAAPPAASWMEMPAVMVGAPQAAPAAPAPAAEPPPPAAIAAEMPAVMVGTPQVVSKPEKPQPTSAPEKPQAASAPEKPQAASAPERPQAPPGQAEKGRVWVVVGGGDKGGIVTRTGKDLSSPQAQVRLATGSLVQEMALEGERLHFLRLTGAGPSSGWASLRLGQKPLLEQAPQADAMKATEALMKSGGHERWLDILSSRERIAIAGENWYEVLDVFPDAEADAIKKAHRALSLLHHPDKTPDHDDGTFKKVQNAYEEAMSWGLDAAARAKIMALRQQVKKWAAGARSDTFITKIDPDEMMEMLLDNSCVVLNVSEEEGMLRDADELVTFESLNYLKLRLKPEAFQERLGSLKEDENRIITVSWSGGRCGEFCTLLVDIFGFEADQFCVLHGGIQAWEDWTRNPKNAKFVKKLRQHLHPT